MRLRRARTLVVTFDGEAPVLCNFMTRNAVPTKSLALDLLSRADTWQTPEYFYSLYPTTEPSLVGDYLRAFTEQGFLVVEGTEAAALDTEYEDFWEWQATTGSYHFGIKDSPWLNAEQSAAWLQQISVTKPPVPLFTTNEGFERVEMLEPPDLEDGLLAVMNRRRSIRSYTPDAVPREVLRDCLFAGLGITGFLDTQMPGEEPRVPLKMTPSGGGRNPYEGYVYAQSVEGLDFGLYHYSAIDHSLGLVTNAPAVTMSALLAQQIWTEGASFAILLVANFARTMWKYPHPNAYRVVLIEAGHIAQNVALVAASHGLSATPTGAVTDSAARELLQLNWVKQSLVIAIVVGKPSPDAFETQTFIPRAGNAQPLE